MSARFDSLLQRSLRGPTARSTTCSHLMSPSDRKLTYYRARAVDSDSHARLGFPPRREATVNFLGVLVRNRAQCPRLATGSHYRDGSNVGRAVANAD